MKVSYDFENDISVALVELGSDTSTKSTFYNSIGKINIKYPFIKYDEKNCDNSDFWDWSIKYNYCNDFRAYHNNRPFVLNIPTEDRIIFAGVTKNVVVN